MPWPIPAGHPLLSSAALGSQSGSKGTALFSMRLNNHPGLAFLVDHRVQGTGVFPAAGFAEAAGAASLALMGRGSSSGSSPTVLGATIAAPLQVNGSVSDTITAAGAMVEVDLTSGRCQIFSQGMRHGHHQ